jgi:exonuclease III
MMDVSSQTFTGQPSRQMRVFTWNVNGLVRIALLLAEASRHLMMHDPDGADNLNDKIPSCACVYVQKPTAKNIELRYGSLQAFFEEMEADIVCFQETKLMSDSIPQSLKHVPGFESFWTCSSGKKGYSGCATYVKLNRAACDAYDDACLGGT